MQHFPALVGYLVMEVLALVALLTRLRRKAKLPGTIIMFIVDASLGIFVIGDLVYLYLMGRAVRKQAIEG